MRSWGHVSVLPLPYCGTSQLTLSCQVLQSFHTAATFIKSTSISPCQCYPPSIPGQDGNNILLYWPEGILVPVPVHLHHLGAAIVPENVVIVIFSSRYWRKIGKDEVWLTRVDKCYWIAAQDDNVLQPEDGLEARGVHPAGEDGDQPDSRAAQLLSGK